MAHHQWNQSSSAPESFFSNSSAFPQPVGNPLPQSPSEHTLPNRQTPNNHGAFSDECFRHIPDRCVQLRTVLGFLLATQWWASNQRPPPGNNLVQFMVEARDPRNANKKIYKCLFCDEPHNSAPSATQCVYGHINFAPP